MGLSEHVTYWNRLGWADPFSAEAYTSRQDAYGQRFQLDSVYTPQMVINGEEQIVGSDASALGDALKREGNREPIELQILSLKPAGRALSVHFSAGAAPGGKAYAIFAAITDDKARSQVLRGENAGRALEHVAVARTLLHVATVQGPRIRWWWCRYPKRLRVALTAGNTSCCLRRS